MQPLHPGQVEGGDDPGPPLPRRDKIDVVGSLRLQVQKDLGQALYRDLPAQSLGADGVVLAEAALEGAAGEEHRAAAPGAADAGLLPEVQGRAGRFQGAARPTEARLPGGPVGFALSGQRVQASGTATEMVLGIISKSFAKDLTELLLFIIPFMTWNVVYYDRILYIMQKYYISDGGCHAHRKRGDPGSFEISLPAGTGLPLAGGRRQ